MRVGDPLEADAASCPEPADHLRPRAEPGAGGLQPLNQTDIEIAPASFGRMTSVVPQHGQHAPRGSRMIDQRNAPLLRVGFGEIEVVWIEQRAVLNVKRQLEEGFCAERTECLRRAVPASNGPA